MFLLWQCLCNALVSVAHCLATSEVYPAILALFVAYRLIPLDKNPGVYDPLALVMFPKEFLQTPYFIA